MCRGTGLGALASMPRLATLTLAQCGCLDEAGMAALARLASLRTLVLDNCEQLADAGAAHTLTRAAPCMLLLMYGNAAEVVCQEADGVVLCTCAAAAGIARLAALTGLRALSLRNVSELTVAGLAALAPLQQLAALNLAGCCGLTHEGEAPCVAGTKF